MLTNFVAKNATRRIREKEKDKDKDKEKDKEKKKRHGLAYYLNHNWFLEQEKEIWRNLFTPYSKKISKLVKSCPASHGHTA